jgi:hypothetical protein
VIERSSSLTIGLVNVTRPLSGHLGGLTDRNTSAGGGYRPDLASLGRRGQHETAEDDSEQPPGIV